MGGLLRELLVLIKGFYWVEEGILEYSGVLLNFLQN